MDVAASEMSERSLICGMVTTVLEENERPQRRQRAAAMPGEQRREAILDAVGEAVVEREMDLTTKELAGLAGVAEGTLFRAFGSKEELLVAAFAHRLAALAQDDSWKRELAGENANQAAPDALGDSLARYMEVVTDRIGEWTHLMSILHRFLRSTEATKARSLREASKPEMERVRKLYMATLADFADTCRALLAPHQGELRCEIDQAVAFVQSTATALALSRQFHDFGLDCRQAADITLNGILAR